MYIFIRYSQTIGTLLQIYHRCCINVTVSISWLIICKLIVNALTISILTIPHEIISNEIVSNEIVAYVTIPNEIISSLT